MHSVATSRILDAPRTSTSAGSPQRWIWPLPRLDGVDPTIVSPSGPTQPDGVVEIGYHHRCSSPCLVPVLAVQDGIVTYAARGNQGATISVDHPGGWSTQYEHLEHVLVVTPRRRRYSRKTRVRAGDVLGHAWRSPLHVRFAVSQLVEGERIAIDPMEQIRTWSVLPWFTEPDLPAPSCVQRPRRSLPPGSPGQLSESGRASMDRTIQLDLGRRVPS